MPRSMRRTPAKPQFRAMSVAFEAQGEKLRAMVDQKHWRIWRVYLAGCQWAFENDEISLYQVVCRKSGRQAHGLPWSRRWMYSR